jgi:chromatin segregation and condensation protein Rec8/ScpA/Scc1 (kleisin family)
MKSDILKDEDIANFDNIINGIEENMPLDERGQSIYDSSGKPNIYPRTPQPRKRKVSIFDLVQALEKALEVENKRKKSVPNMKKIVLKLPEKHFDLGKSMALVYGKVETHYKSKKNKNKVLTFDDLTIGGSKQDKVLTFIPLLHLDNLRKVDLEQEKHFDEIAVKLATPKNEPDAV